MLPSQTGSPFSHRPQTDTGGAGCGSSLYPGVSGDHSELVGVRVDLAAPRRAGVAHDGEDAYDRGPCRSSGRAGLVSARKDGTKVYYRLAGSDVAALWAELRDVASTRLANVDRVRGAYLGKVAYVCHCPGWLADSQSG